MIYIIIILFVILIIIFLNKKEGLQSLSSEVYNNIQHLCNKENTSYFNNLDISQSTQINNKYLNKYIIDQIYPIGSFYVQYPDQNKSTPISTVFPESKSPSKLFPGTTWTKQWDKESIFFRTEGELSNISRLNGLQEYALKQIYGTMSWVQTNYNAPGLGNTGVFSAKANTQTIRTDSGHDNDNGHSNSFDVSSVLKPENVSSNEIRVKNRLMIVWKRTA